MFTRKEIRKLNKFDKIYLLVSGGRDSTFTFLNLWELRNWIKRPVILLHTNTGNRMKEAEQTLALYPEQMKIDENSKKSWKRVDLEARKYLPKKPMQIIIDSLKKLDEAKTLLEEGKYSKKVFPCCYWLKKKPFEKWLQLDDHSNDVFILSIKPGDSNQRGFFLNKLRKEKTHFWFNRRHRTWRYYPLRDCKQETVNSFLAINKLFWNTEHSGCRICPIIALFDLDKLGVRYTQVQKVLANIYS